MTRHLPLSISQALRLPRASPIRIIIRVIFPAVLAGFACAACLSTARPEPVQAPAQFSPSPNILPSPTGTAASLPEAFATPTAGNTPSPVLSKMCSPLQSVRLNELPQIVSNPFEAPLPGQDDGHHGTDLAFYRWGSRIGMLGLPVQSVFDGKVAAALPNRPPYGNMVIVETSWEQLPASIRDLYGSPPPTPAPASIHLTCPDITRFKTENAAQPSLYLLYAHLKDPSALQTGEDVSCGEPIGAVGTTGSSVNPHLHLETRFGPAGAVFTAMAHYTADATRAEMTSYCTWRVSGEFSMIDPMNVLSMDPGVR